MLPRNVLIFHSAALGDFILTWPFALTLARIYPQSRIYYVTHPQKGELAERALRLEYSSADTGWHALYAADAALPEPLAKLLGNAHTVVSFIASSGDKWVENVQRLAPQGAIESAGREAPGEPCRAYFPMVAQPVGGLAGGAGRRDAAFAIDRRSRNWRAGERSGGHRDSSRRRGGGKMLAGPAFH